MTNTLDREEISRGILITMLPGPDRRRTQSLYQYRLVFRHPDVGAEGCLMLWQVTGGRQIYQVALERGSRQEMRWHCTCADAVYRGELAAHYVCKHIRGLIEFTPPMPTELRRAA